MYKNRERLHEKSVLMRYRMIYQGLRSEVFYWEFINVLRKTILISLNVFLPESEAYLKALCAIALLILILSLQEKLRPYKKPVFNQIEYREIMTSVRLQKFAVTALRQRHSTVD